MAIRKKLMVAYFQSKALEWRFKADVYYKFQAKYFTFLKGSNSIRELGNYKVRIYLGFAQLIPWQSILDIERAE